MAGHMNTKYCECRHDKCECYEVPHGIGLEKADVFSVSAIVVSVEPNIPEGLVNVDLNCKELAYAYYNSTVGTEYSYEEFMEEVQEKADEAASATYTPIQIAQGAIGDNYDARLIVLRLCIKVKWLKIYIILKL